VIETKVLKSMARETAELALQLAALPAEGLRTDHQALADLEYLALRILKEATTARTASVRGVGERRGMFRVADLLPR
jgi:hypothetical protein